MLPRITHSHSIKGTKCSVEYVFIQVTHYINGYTLAALFDLIRSILYPRIQLNRIRQTRNTLFDAIKSVPGLSNTIELYAWVQDATNEIKQSSKGVTIDVMSHLNKDIFNATFGAFNSMAMGNAWKHLVQTGSFDHIKACWRAL